MREAALHHTVERLGAARVVYDTVDAVVEGLQMRQFWRAAPALALTASLVNARGATPGRLATR